MFLTKNKNKASTKEKFTQKNSHITKIRASQFISSLNKRIKGSVTIEAAIILPIFIFAITSFLYMIEIMYWQENIHNSVVNAAHTCAEYGFIYKKMGNLNSENDSESKEIINKTKLLGSGLMYMEMKKYLDEGKLSKSCVQGGLYGINIINSKYLEEKDNIEINMLYAIKIPIPYFHIGKFYIHDTIVVRAWTGYIPEDENHKGQEKSVYITENGTVYHISAACTHLKLNISQISLSQLPNSRNHGGGKYYPCKNCTGTVNINENSAIYITEDGDKYHTNINCSGLMRYVRSVPISEVSGMGVCSRCGK